MNTKITSCILLLLVCITSKAQVRQQAGKVDVNTAPGGIVSEITEEPLPIKGSRYLFEEWEMGSIRLKSGQTLDNISFRYDLSRDRFETMEDQKKSNLTANKVYSFNRLIQDQREVTYVNADGYLLDQLPLSGFYEVLIAANESGIGLFLKTDLKLKKSYYVPALDVGEKADTYTKVASTFLVSGVAVHKLPKKEAAFWDLFDESLTVKAWAKEEKLKWKRKEDLVKILEHYNSTVANQ